MTDGGASANVAMAGLRRAPTTRTISATTLGEVWLATAGLILREGRAARWGPDATREIALLTMAVSDPDPDDAGSLPGG